MRHVVIHAFILFLAAHSVGSAIAQDQPQDVSSASAKIFNAPGGLGLTLPSQAAPAAVVATFLNSRGYSPETVASLTVTNEGRTSRTGITHLRFAQEVEGLAVYGTYVKAAIHDDGRLVHLIENLATPPAVGTLPTVIDEREALDAALDEVHPGVSVSLTQGPRKGNSVPFTGDGFFHRDPAVTRVAIPMASGVLQEGYLVETWSEEGNLLHHTLIGGTGRVLKVELRTDNDSYNIFPDHPGISTQQVRFGPWTGSNSTAPESPLGWLNLEADGVTLSDQPSTAISGNNVNAYLDWDANNVPDNGSYLVTGGNFLSVANLAVQPNTVANKEVAIQNLFYFNNVIHDKLYRHGFVESVGNFQVDNFGKGGLGGDPVNAEAQDGSGFNNANFATPSDGTPPRMQMYLWNPGPHQVEMSDGITVYEAYGALFGPTPNDVGPLSDVVLVNDGTGTPSDGCEAFGGVTGKIALIDRGICDFVVKVENAELAGAVGVIVVNNAGNSLLTMADNGDGDRIDIPSLFIGQDAGAAIKSSSEQARLVMTERMLDGDLDSDIIWHEYGHGLTWRMIGGMGETMSRAIGEGMSDVLSILINGNDVVGEYASDNPAGIRSAPYSGYSSHRTYGDFLPSLGVHSNGEIYAAAVWRVWELFRDNADPAPVPKDTLFDYVIDGMNYTPSSPSMEQMRDGILQSAAGSGHECLIWTGFAELGIGLRAKGSDTKVIKESFALPSSCADGGDGGDPGGGATGAVNGTVSYASGRAGGVEVVILSETSLTDGEWPEGTVAS